MHSSSDIFIRTGEISSKELLANYAAFTKSYQSYQVQQSDVGAMKDLEGKDLYVFFGLWCHDSQREVPRLLKLIERSEVNLKSITLVAINTKKVVPEKYQAQFKVEFTPTIFVVKNNEIVNKMVEKPIQSIALDLIKIN